VSGPPAGPQGLPLAGVRVVDFGEAYAGPYCCTMLADAGAEVIRVENIHRMPANQRGMPNPAPPYLGYKDGDPGERPWNRFALQNSHERNKYGITLDLKQPRGRELFLELVARSDVVVANFARTAMESLRVEYGDLTAVNPKLIMAFISGYGADGPYRDYAALGSTIDAVSAHQSLRGYPESAAIDNQHSYFSDSITAFTTFFVVTAALHRRRLTGEGAFFDMALTESMFPAIGGPITAYSATGELPLMPGNRDPAAAPHGCYRSRALPDDPDSQRLTDDRWIAIACRDEEEWSALLRVMGRPELAADPRFRELAARQAHQDELDEVINAWTEHQDATALMHELQSAGVPAMALMPDSELFEDPHLKARGYFAEVDHRDAGRYRMPGPVWRSRKHDIRVRMPTYCLGEHNREILQGLLGVTDEEFATLEAGGVIGEAYAEDVQAAHR
jgi:crotonobetainyl-CoA:carnitine CoA-transferase CaiB-like acyl-CoA transferase